jgi:phytoene dehydrogenase-like protein
VTDVTHADVAVIGAGFGGLGAALRLAEQGARVVVLERLTYPGGCASTFSRAGYRFEAGATLFSGFGEGQLFRDWIDRHELDVTIDWLDPVVEFRAPSFDLAVPSDRDLFVEEVARLPGVDAEAVRAFFRDQRAVADVLWEVLDDPASLLPLGPGGISAHLRRGLRYLPFARLVGRPLGEVLRDHGLHRSRALRTFLDGMCQITIQCAADEAEAPFAMGTMDYYFRGTGHVRGGIGTLASELVSAIERLGGTVRFASEATGLARDGDGWRVSARRGDVCADHVIANLLPQNVSELLGDECDANRSLGPLGEAVEDGWGACMLYLVVRPPVGQETSPHHLELVHYDEEPLIEGNHVFCSVSGPHDADRAPEGLRTMTVSTHVPMRRLRALREEGEAAYVQEIQARMRRTIEARAPEWIADVRHEMTASPRTFERFTGRFLGHVGGVPRRAGLHHYKRLAPRPVLPGLWLVGDSVFPGQSTLATALGGVKTAEAVMRSASRRRPIAAM